MHIKPIAIQLTTATLDGEHLKKMVDKQKGKSTTASQSKSAHRQVTTITPHSTKASKSPLQPAQSEFFECIPKGNSGNGTLTNATPEEEAACQIGAELGSAFSNASLSEVFNSDDNSRMNALTAEQASTTKASSIRTDPVPTTGVKQGGVTGKNVENNNFESVASRVPVADQETVGWLNALGNLDEAILVGAIAILVFVVVDYLFM